MKAFTMMASLLAIGSLAGVVVAATGMGNGFRLDYRTSVRVVRATE